jgi:hypothetical protein
MDAITLHVQDSGAINLHVGGVNDVPLDIGATVYGGGMPYTGDYTITPSEETQVLPTQSRQLSGNIVIEPIPSNYGLITWNGSTITVS